MPLSDPAHITLTGRFEPNDELTYRHVPFAVPNGARQLHVQIGYNARIGSSPTLRGGNTLDIGLFDARGAESGSDGFRGWSGSEKTEITIDRDWATPPYRAGALQPGEWQLLLGAYKVAPEGLDYRADIWFDSGIEPESIETNANPLPAQASRTPVIEPGWLRGDLHCHSVHSDGDSTPDELVAAAKALGFDFLGITDHNAPPASEKSVDGLIFIPGTEVTTYGGHWNVWGGTRWYDFREPVTDAMEREMQIATETAGLVSINHPRPLGPNWEYGPELSFHTVEVWNGPWLLANAISLGLWERLLQAGRRVAAIGGSDTHKLKGIDTGFPPRAKLGQPTVWVKPDGPTSMASILAALRTGRSFLSASPNGPQLILEHEGSDMLRVHVGGATGCALMLIGDRVVVGSFAIDADDWEMRIPYPMERTYVRAQVIDHVGEMQALTNPVWRE